MSDTWWEFFGGCLVGLFFLVCAFAAVVLGVLLAHFGVWVWGLT